MTGVKTKASLFCTEILGHFQSRQQYLTYLQSFIKCFRDAMNTDLKNQVQDYERLIDNLKEEVIFIHSFKNFYRASSR